MIEELKCPECGEVFDARETLDESGIFSCWLNLVCNVCESVLQVQAEPTEIKWHIHKVTTEQIDKPKEK